ncbi:amino acid permease [Saccharopolyspora erythraea]|uniref:amino acid permease n=1 Tax=Saccharopolyspora erythraea TaxID=1836 RepID=UPI001BA67B38|nr:amino acid permease [Saccharopolyspora erythraea]QUH01198.1 amino acid permease [Saccharopolyspora erythraea]
MAQELELPRRLEAGTSAIPQALGAMLGVGLFVGLAPAFAAAGPWSLFGLPVAALAAICCAVSTAHQSAAYRGPGAAYTCTRSRVGLVPARIGAATHIAGQAAAMAAIAGVIGDLLVPSASGGAAAVAVLLAVLAATAGLRIRGGAAWLWLLLIFAVVAVVVAVCFGIDAVPAPPSAPPGSDSAVGITGAAGVLFFAFLGFERLTAPAEERDRFDWRVVRRGVTVSLAVTTALLGLLSAGLLYQLGPARLALSPVPVIDVLGAAAASDLRPLVAVGVAVALLPVLLAALEIARSTGLALVRDGDLPAALGRRARSGTPYPLDLLVGAAAAVVAQLVDPIPAMAFATCCVLVHYAFANAGARLLLSEERAWPMRAACLGMGLAVVLAMSMPVPALLATLAVVIVGPVATGAFSRRWS